MITPANVLRPNCQPNPHREEYRNRALWKLHLLPPLTLLRAELDPGQNILPADCTPQPS